jgi:D-arabinose 1-dehydrogenase-like Zn-dependent alcohol dehydrogenase
MMQAVVYRGANDLRLETLPVPPTTSSELLVKVAVCGVCPTDIKKIHYGTVAPPRIFPTYIKKFSMAPSHRRAYSGMKLRARL